MAVIAEGSDRTTETAAERNARLQAAFNKASTSTKTTTPTYVQATQQAAARIANVIRPTVSTRRDEARTPAPAPAPAQTASPGFVRRVVEPPAPITQPLQTGFPELDQGWYGQQDTGEAALAAAQQTYLGTAPTTTEPQVVESKYTGRQYYMGGSEQAYLGPVKQAEEYFFGTGDRWGLGSSYIDIAPEDRKPPPILNQSTVRILTKSGPSYLEGVDYGPSMTMEDIERIYEYDPATGHYLLKGAADPTADYGYSYYASSGQGYASAGPGYGNYGYGSRGGQIGGNMINWRIGF